MMLADYLIQYLHQIGVTHVFGVSGANIEDILDATVRIENSPRFILAKHEFCAGCMADGYSRVGRSLGVVMSTSGGGALNLVPALGESLASGQPVLAILGMPPENLEGKGAFQDSSGLNGSLPGEALFSTLASKYFARIDSVEAFPAQLQQAVSAALTPPFGTSILMIPKNLQTQLLSNPLFIKPKLPDSHFVLDAAVTETCLASRGSILLIAGEEIQRLGLEQELQELAERLNALVALTPEAKSVYDNRRERYLGVSGVAGHTSVTEAAERCQTLLIIGTRLQLMSRLGLEPFLDSRQIIYLNNSAPCHDFSSNPEKKIISHSLKQVMQQLLQCLPMQEKRIPKHSSVRYEKTQYIETTATQDLNFETIFQRLNGSIRNQDLIFADAGNTGGAAVHYLNAAAYFGIALGMGGMGYALGASIGACLQSGQRTWCLLGDGALLMHGMEIHTAIQHRLPLRFLVFNNNAHAMCYDRDLLYLSGNNHFNLFEKSQFGAGMAQMFPGFYSHEVNSLDDLQSHLDKLEHYPLSALLSINLDYHELPPFVPFLERLRSMNL